MASFASYAAGAIPRIGDYVRCVHPHGPRNGLTVLGFVPSGLRCIEDVSGRIHTIPARRLDLLCRNVRVPVAA